MWVTPIGFNLKVPHIHFLRIREIEYFMNRAPKPRDTFFCLNEQINGNKESCSDHYAVLSGL